MQFDFKFATDAIFGHNRYRELPSLLRERGWSRPGFLMDAALRKTPPAIDLLRLLRQEFNEDVAVLESRSGAEPDYDYLDECAARFRGLNIDCLVGLGGGSAMDLCKGICVLLRNPGKGIDYRGMDKVQFPGLPAVLLPATAGTGSEATFTAVFVDKARHTKMGINGRHVAAQLAILDPAFTASCPHPVAVGAGLDAMVHSLEAFMTCRSNPIIFELAQQAFTLLFRAFPAALGNPDASEARLEMLIGSYLAGITLRYSGGGIAGALSYPLGGEYHVPHGLAGGVLLKHILRENIEQGYEGFADLHTRLFPEEATAPTTERSRRFLGRFTELLTAIRAPSTLEGFAVSFADIPAVVRQTMEQRAGVLKNNPVPVTEDMLSRILEAVVVRDTPPSASRPLN